MKYILSFYITLLYFLALSGQNVDNSRRDWVWPLGYDYYSDSIGVDAVTFDFSGVATGDTMRISYGHQAFEMNRPNASVCDTTGDLLLYTNGCAFGNKVYSQVLEDYIVNYTNAHELMCYNNQGLGSPRKLLLIPDNYHENIYHMFSHAFSLFDFGIRCDTLYYQKIITHNENFSLQVNDEIVFEAGMKTIEDSSFLMSHLSACLHGNGKDWWIITAFQRTNTFQKYLLTDNSILGPFSQQIGEVIFDEYDGSTGNSVFSPDGTKFVDYAIHADLQIFDFDRCTGLLSNPLHIPITDSADVYYAAGCAISNNSRYLYVASTYHVYQFDLYATDIASSKIVVAEWDGYVDEDPLFPMLFYQLQLAPDNKIYMTSPGGRTNIHVIEHPDSAGLACQVTQHKYHLQTAISGGLPNFPYYRLGAADPPCPVSGLVEAEGGGAASLRVRPNPVADDLWYETNAPVGTPWLLSSSLGKVMQSGSTTSSYWTRLGLGTLPPGVYMLTIQGQQGLVSKRIVKQ